MLTTVLIIVFLAVACWWALTLHVREGAARSPWICPACEEQQAAYMQFCAYCGKERGSA